MEKLATKKDMDVVNDNLYYSMSQVEDITNRKYVTIMKCFTTGRLDKYLYHEKNEEIYKPEDWPGGARRKVVIKGDNMKECFGHVK